MYYYHHEFMGGCGHVLEARRARTHNGTETIARCLDDSCPNSAYWQDWNWIKSHDERYDDPCRISLYIIRDSSSERSGGDGFLIWNKLGWWSE